MLFNDYIFAIFFLIVFGGYLLNVPWTVKKTFLLLMSYLFYAAWNAPYLLIIIFSTLVDFFAARRIHAAQRIGAKRAWLAVSLLGNLGVLSYFKYGGFVLENTTLALAQIGVVYEPLPWNVLLPVGISFFTFQTLTYSIDVYRGRLKPDHSLLDFAVFVTFFPQLVAGPIVRARNFMPQLKAMPAVTWDRIGWGAVLFLIGLFEKVVIADGLLSPVVDSIYYKEGTLPAVTVLLANFAFMGQIFADFSGYSLMAIGVALMLGFTLPENFRAPFAAIGYVDLWRRWHITMSTWFRDYLYASIRGRARSTLTNTIIAQIITMTIIGLWHGASWTFVIWGVFNGLVLAVEIVARDRIGHWRVWHTLPATLAFWGITMLLFSQSALFFRAEDFGQSLDMMASFIGPAEIRYHPPVMDIAVVVITLLGIFGAHWQIRTRPLRETVDALPLSVVTLLGAIMIVAIVIVGGSSDAFIYFQF